MIERALRILPALNNVLCRHSSPLTSSDALALTRIASALTPFKRAILKLCSNKADLISADKVFLLLLRDLRECATRLSDKLCEGFKNELRIRRTSLSTAFAFLKDPTYDCG